MGEYISIFFGILMIVAYTHITKNLIDQDEDDTLTSKLRIGLKALFISALFLSPCFLVPALFTLRFGLKNGDLFGVFIASTLASAFYIFLMQIRK